MTTLVAVGVRLSCRFSDWSSLHERKDSNTLVWYFGDDFLPFYHAHDYGTGKPWLLGTKQIQDVLPFSSEVNQLFTGLIFVTLVILLMLFFLDTKLGQAYIATGDNLDMARSLVSIRDVWNLWAWSCQMVLLPLLVP